MDLRDQCPKLSLVIDLTNTTRYYKAGQLKATCRSALDHVKIETEGHVVPKNTVVHRFFNVVEEAMAKSPDALIGVHCTHGVNRTGYLICRYLVQKLNWAPNDAIKAFGLARGHDIERKNYLQDLQGRKSQLWPTLSEGRLSVPSEGHARRFECSSNWFGNGNEPDQRSIVAEIPRQESLNDLYLRQQSRPRPQEDYYHMGQSYVEAQYRHHGQYYSQEERQYQGQYQNPGQYRHRGQYYHHQEQYQDQGQYRYRGQHYHQEKQHHQEQYQNQGRYLSSSTSSRGPNIAREPFCTSGPDFSKRSSHYERQDNSTRGPVDSRKPSKSYSRRDPEYLIRSHSWRDSKNSRNKSS